MKCANIYYFRHINKIGGIETFFYELAKKYYEYDIVIVYNSADPAQLSRLKKYFRCVKYMGEHIECEKAFFNFNTDIIDNVTAKEYCLVVHGDYRMLRGAPPTHPKITKYYGVSQTACDSFTMLTGLPCELTYNPITLEKVKPVITLVSACRLGDPVKGGARTNELIKKLDEYSAKNGLNYVWYIFSDIKPQEISKNVIIMEPRLDILPYIAGADYVVQLSDNFEGYNYTVNESLSVGTPVVITPCYVYAELGIDDTMSISLDFDMKNIDKVVEDIFSRKFKFKYTPPADNWNNIFVHEKSQYQKELETKYKVKALDTYKQFCVIDSELGKIPKEGETWIVSRARLDILLGDNDKGRQYVKVVSEIVPKK